MNRIGQHLLWLAVAVLGAFAFATVALSRGEAVSALWIVVAALCIYLIAYRYYSRFIADKVMQLDPKRMTPAWRHNDGLDYVPTNKAVLFGHHFAAIAGAGPLVGPVLAAQMGYLPGMLWLLAGVVFAGAVQDFMVLFISTRRDGRSLGDLVKSEMGTVPGMIALFGCFMIMIIILAVLALIVVKALADSPWGTFTVALTIPIAILMGVYLRWIRPGRILEVSILGFVLQDQPDLRAEVIERGQAYGYVLMERIEREPNGEDEIELASGGLLLDLTCLHSADGAPLALERRLIALSAAPEAARVDFGVTPPGSWLLDQAPWTEAENRIAAVEVESTDARLLGLKTGAACLRVERRTWRDGQGVTRVWQTFPGDRYDLVARFSSRGDRR